VRTRHCRRQSPGPTRSHPISPRVAALRGALHIWGGLARTHATAAAEPVKEDDSAALVASGSGEIGVTPRGGVQDGGRGARGGEQGGGGGREGGILGRLRDKHGARSGEQGGHRGGGGQGQAGGNQEDEDDQGRAELHRLAPGVPLSVPPSAPVHGIHRQRAAPQL